MNHFEDNWVKRNKFVPRWPKSLRTLGTSLFRVALLACIPLA